MTKMDISYGGKSDEELLEIALQETPRNADGSHNTGDVIDNLAGMITINVDAARRREAKRIFDDRTKVRPGKNYSLQLTFEGFPPQAYLPDRFVLGDDGTFMCLGEATIRYIRCDARRSRKHANDSTASANFKQAEYEAFSEWVIDEGAKGHGDLTFGRFASETGILSTATPPPKRPSGSVPPAASSDQDANAG